jgi:hypothetical protein
MASRVLYGHWAHILLSIKIISHWKDWRIRQDLSLRPLPLESACSDKSVVKLTRCSGAVVPFYE